MSNSSAEFKLLGYKMPTLQVGGDDLDAIRKRLTLFIERKPHFFKNLEIVVEFDQSADELDVHEVLQLVRELRLTPFAIVGRNSLVGESLPTFPAGSAETKVQQEDPAITEIVTQRVRSGQRIFSKGDLVVTATVSSGAELMAEGSIHIYGTMAGRAFAGSQGDRNAAVFCSDMQAELISIAGVYRLGDQIDVEMIAKKVRVSLGGDALDFELMEG